MKKGFVFALLTLVIWGIAALHSVAQTSNIRLESRVDRVESAISRLESRLTRLENRSSVPGPLPTPNPSPADGLLTDLSLEEQFDNLATLAIELKLQVRDLEARVNQLEQALGQ